MIVTNSAFEIFFTFRKCSFHEQILGAVRCIYSFTEHTRARLLARATALLPSISVAAAARDPERALNVRRLLMTGQSGEKVKTDKAVKAGDGKPGDGAIAVEGSSAEAAVLMAQVEPEVTWGQLLNVSVSCDVVSLFIMLDSSNNCSLFDSTIPTIRMRSCSSRCWSKSSSYRRSLFSSWRPAPLLEPAT